MCHADKKIYLTDWFLSCNVFFMIGIEYRIFYEELFKKVLKDAPKGFFDEAALPSYTHKNKLMSYLFWDRLNKAFSLIGDVENKSVLDFGAGGGVTFKYLSDRRAKIYACEKEFFGLTESVAKALNLNIPVYRDISDIKDIKFDLIFALDVLEHVDDLDMIMKEIKGLSHSNTKLIISGPTENFIYKIGRFLAGFKGHYHLRNIYDIEKELRKKGFKILKTKSLYFPVTLFRISLWGIND